MCRERLYIFCSNTMKVYYSAIKSKAFVSFAIILTQLCTLASCVILCCYASKISSFLFFLPVLPSDFVTAPRLWWLSLTWTQTHQCVAWCCPGESDAGSCICRGLPSHFLRGWGRWGSFCSHPQLQPAQCSATEREQRKTAGDIFFPLLSPFPIWRIRHCPSLISPPFFFIVLHATSYLVWVLR